MEECAGCLFVSYTNGSSTGELSSCNNAFAPVDKVMAKCNTGGNVFQLQGRCCKVLQKL